MSSLANLSQVNLCPVDPPVAICAQPQGTTPNTANAAPLQSFNVWICDYEAFYIDQNRAGRFRLPVLDFWNIIGDFGRRCSGVTANINLPECILPDFRSKMDPRLFNIITCCNYVRKHCVVLLYFRHNFSFWQRQTVVRRRASVTFSPLTERMITSSCPVYI